MIKNTLLEKTFKKNEVYKGKIIKFRNDKIILPNGKEANREFMVHPGASAVIAEYNGKIIFVKQYRYPIKEETFEIPAGKLHSKKDDPKKRALEELKEETGFKAKKIQFLLKFWPTCAFSNEILNIYLAKDLKPGKKHPDEDEFLNTEFISLKDALKMIKKGKIKDSKTIIALFYYNLIKNNKEKI